MHPFFLPAAGSSRLFAVHWSPRSASKQAVLVLPPFAEEMNKCRPMLAAQARAFAEAGLHVLMVDLFGTGDSEGDFAEVQWQRWLQDLKDARAWLHAELDISTVHLFAVRAGALFVPALFAEPGTAAKLMLWQPVLRGADVWRQFLRTRLMADSARGQSGNSGDLEQQLAREGVLEIAGYTIPAALAADLNAAQLDEPTAQRAARTLWAEVSAAEPPALSTAGARSCKQWTQGGVQLQTVAVPGEPFWSTPEIGWARALLGPTCAFATDASLT